LSRHRSPRPSQICHPAEKPANNVEAIDTAAPVRGFEFSADF
jgi:hypothetical protein